MTSTKNKDSSTRRLWPGAMVALIAGMLLTATGARLSAQACSDSRSNSGSVTCALTVTMTPTTVMRITLSSINTALGTPTEAHFTAGFQDVTSSMVTATVKANRAFRVQVTSNGTKFTFANTSGHSFADPNKPASDMKWATTQGGLAATTNNMGTTGTLISQGATAGVSQPIFVRSGWQFTRDVPGTYGLTVNLTLSAP